MAQEDRELGIDVVYGYKLEGRITKRFADGWGYNWTRLPEGHLARRDTVDPPVKVITGK